MKFTDVCMLFSFTYVYFYTSFIFYTRVSLWVCLLLEVDARCRGTNGHWILGPIVWVIGGLAAVGDGAARVIVCV